MEGLILVAKFNKEYQAHLAKDKLGQEAITATILEHEDPISSLDGLYEVFVGPENEIRARAIIDKLDE